MSDGHASSRPAIEDILRVGRQTFLGVELLVDHGSLVPREETEILGRATLSILSDLAKTRPPRVIDMCCGSGNLACALAALVPSATVFAADLTDEAVALARRNVEHLGLSARVRVAQGDLFAALSAHALEGTIDLVVCNPPYISTQRLAKDRASLLEHEPREAFDGGPYGLSIHQRVIKEAPTYLVSGGTLAVEFGLGQDKQIMRLFDRAGAYAIPSLIADSAGAPRVCMGVCMGRTKA